MNMYKLGRQIRPLANRVNCRAFCSRPKRNIPIALHGRSRGPWVDLFRDPWRDMQDMERYFDGFRRDMQRLMGPSYFGNNFVRPRDNTARNEVSSLKYDNKSFELKLDVQEFSPSELKIKMAGNKLTVSGKQEQKQDDHGFISREFHRELIIPEDVDLESMTSSISEEGVLTIRANIKAEEEGTERVIDIQTEKTEKKTEDSEKKA